MFDFKFMGAFCLTGPDGVRIHIRSRKAVGLLGLLATADRGERTRAWIQEKLWGSREVQQAQTSLRRELTDLRAKLNVFGDELLQADVRTVRLNVDLASIDVRSHYPRHDEGEFLEGIELSGERNFGEWLAEIRKSLAVRSDHMQARIAVPAEHPPAPPKPEKSLALAVMPLGEVRHTGRAFRTLRSDLTHLLVKCLNSRKWLPILVPDSVAETGLSAKDGITGTEDHDARYVLEGQINMSASSASVVFSLKQMPGPRLLWTETLHLAKSCAEINLFNLVAELCNVVSREVACAEIRRIQPIPSDKLGDSELTHLVRYLLGQLSLDDLALARTYLNRIFARAGRNSESVILDCCLKVLTVMGSDYGSVDLNQLRTWASTAINADPTDWRGTLLASQVELWLGNADLATTHAQFANELCACNQEILGQLGAAYAWSGQPDLAIAELTTALSLSLRERRPYLILCNLALAHLMRDEPNRALPFCDQAASCVPELGLAYLLKVEALVRLGRDDEAARVYLESIRDRFDDLIAIVRRQRVLPTFWIASSEQTLAVATSVAEHARTRETQSLGGLSSQTGGP
ncbi:MAG: hypothetical protein ABW128_10925 [Rhizorhabdus sp.]